jgi:hypothetical protein
LGNWGFGYLKFKIIWILGFEIWKLFGITPKADASSGAFGFCNLEFLVSEL